MLIDYDLLLLNTLSDIFILKLIYLNYLLNFYIF